VNFCSTKHFPDALLMLNAMLIESSFNVIADGKKANRGNNCFRHHVLGLKGALLHSLLCLSLIFLFSHFSF
jgi:hypothetical protein